MQLLDNKAKQHKNLADCSEAKTHFEVITTKNTRQLIKELLKMTGSCGISISASSTPYPRLQQRRCRVLCQLHLRVHSYPQSGLLQAAQENHRCNRINTEASRKERPDRQRQGKRTRSLVMCQNPHTHQSSAMYKKWGKGLGVEIRHWKCNHV